MKKQTFLFVLILSAVGLILNCCGNLKNEDPYKDSRLIYDQAIAVHDEVMPRMDRIMQLEKSLKTEKEKISDEATIAEIDANIQQLERAHERMMQWMRNITPVPETEGAENPDSAENVPDPDEMENIQSNSLEEIKEVQRIFNESIRDAEMLLESLQES